MLEAMNTMLIASICKAIFQNQFYLVFIQVHLYIYHTFSLPEPEDKQEEKAEKKETKKEKETDSKKKTGHDPGDEL